MRRVTRLRIFFILFLMVFLLLSVGQELFGFSHRKTFPFYSWELSFGRLLTQHQIFKVYVHSLNGSEFEVKKDIEELIGTRWKNSTSYKIVADYVDTLAMGDQDQIARARRAFEHEYFKKSGIFSVHYEIVGLTVDPIAFYKKQEVLEVKNLGEFVFRYE